MANMIVSACRRNSKKKWLIQVIFFPLFICAVAANAQIGNLLWEDNFDSLDANNWTMDVGDGCDIGLCGWGNQELQWYAENNVSVQNIPGENGNNALVLEARRESINGYSFSSGKVTSANKIAVQYGLIETRIRVPNLDQGLWPAAWMLGTTTAPWPNKGEIDMMEMGHRADEKVRQGHPGVSSNNYVGSNLIFYADAACVEGNPTCAASTAYDTTENKPYVSNQAMNNRFVIYRTYWTSSQIRFTVEDNGVEYDLYESPFSITPESNAFQAPFYLLLNLAVGGNFTDAAVPDQVTAPFAAPMYIDYVRVYELDGQGEIFEGNITEPEVGVFGVFTENTPSNNALEAGLTSDIYLWDPNSLEGNISAYEGSEVIAWNFTNPGNWFGGGIQARQARDMSNFTDGNLTFNIQIPADVSFRIGVTDTFTNENWITFPAGETHYGLIRNGNWGQVTIPISELRGSLIALQSMQYLFAISSDPANLPNSAFQYAIDNIVWDSGIEVNDSDGDGVIDSLDLCPGTPANTEVDSNGCPMDEIQDIEIASITTSQTNSSSWTSVSFESAFASAPVVVMGAPTFNGSHSMAVRIRNVSTTGFEFMFDEWDYLDGGHTTETVTYIAIPDGEHNWGGLEVRAGRLSAVNQNWQSAALTSGISGVPTVITQQVSDNDTQATTTRVRNISSTSFQVKLQEEEGNDGVHSNESVHFIAIEPGQGSVEGADVLVGQTSNSVTQNWFNIDFGSAYESPKIVAGMQTTDGNDPATVRYRNLTSDSVEVLIHEEQSANAEVAHTSEVVGWVVFGAADTPAVDSDNDSVPDNVDNCPDTPSGAIVDSQGCPTDGDSDGVFDGIDQCPNTLSGVNVDSTGCAISTNVTGIQTTSSDSIEFYVNTTAWADVHYSVNGGGVQNIRMIQTGSQNIYSLSGLVNGDSIAYNFTYWNTDGNFAVDTENATYTHFNNTPIDSDGDGVLDANDNCPNTPPNTAVDASGCPLPAAELNASASASSEFQSAAFAVDDNMGTRWESTHGIDPSSLSLDLGAVFNLSEIEIQWEAANAANYTVEGSNNLNQWTALASFTGGTFGDRTDTLGISGAYRYVRILGTSRSAGNQWGYSIWEVDIFGSATTFLDQDNDGVSDDIDQCPNTTPNTPVDEVGCPDNTNPPDDDDADGIPNAFDQCANTPIGTQVDSVGCPIILSGNIIPLFNESTALEQDIVIETSDALITRISDRARDRHAREDQFQLYDHYLTFYWEHRTASIEIVDRVAKGGDTIEFNVVTQFKLSDNEAELRFFYRGVNTVAEYFNNGVMAPVIDDLHYTRSVSFNQKEGRPLQVGDRMEFEMSQFLDPSVPNGRANYYGTTFLYIVGQGIVPWKAVGEFGNPATELEDSYPIDQAGWLGGETTLPYQYSDEPNDHFMQMATNIGSNNGQPFVLGRRVHHTDFETGVHDEPGNPTFPELSGIAGTHYVNTHCTACHSRNGRSAPAPVGQSLDKWVFKVGDAIGAPDSEIGRVLQPNNTGINNAQDGEGSVSISSWTESNGLRSPNYSFERGTPERFSARIAPQLVGLGLLEAVEESTILAMEDEDDGNNDGISGRAQRSIDPITGDIRLGRFGWKAATSSVKHQIASALNTDIGVMTSVLPNPDCGINQSTCGSSGSELSDTHLDNLVKYVALLGVRAQRDLDDTNVVSGQQLFNAIGCASCHTPTLQTSQFHPFSELRNQTIHPYTDMLLHDMGPGLADNLGEGIASGAEWRTTPLWGIGLSACVTGGLTNPTGAQGDEICTPEHSYLHDGRARTIEEAILWHGGESENAKNNFEGLSNQQRQNVLRFLESL